MARRTRPARNPRAARDSHEARSDGVSISWDATTARQWDAWIDRIDQSTIEQTWAYGEALVGVTPYVPVHGVIYSRRAVIGVVQVVEWRIAGIIRVVKIVRGPLFLETANGDERETTYRLISERYSLARFDLVLWTPELLDTPDARTLLRDLAFRQMITGYSSIWLDLSRKESELRARLNQKWRNQLVQAEDTGLRIRLAHGGAALEWLLTRHEGHRRRRRLRVPAAPFVLAMSLAMRNKQSTLAFTAYSGSEPVAAILVFRHGKSATYYMAWTGPEGRRKHAHNLLLWHALRELRSRGVRWFDLGGVDGLSMPGVSRFKMGLGGRLFTLAGTYM